MAQGSTSAADAQPKRVDTTTASPDAVRAANDAMMQPTADIIAMVSRDVNGEPAQSKNFRVLVDDDAPDHVKDAHWNKAGEAMGAKHVDVNKRTGPDELNHEERAKTEERELARINYREGSKG